MHQNLYNYDNMVQDVLNYEEFVTHFSSDEQKQLLKYLAPVDSFAPPDRFVQFTLYLYPFLSEVFITYTTLKY